MSLPFNPSLYDARKLRRSKRKLLRLIKPSGPDIIEASPDFLVVVGIGGVFVATYAPVGKGVVVEVSEPASTELAIMLVGATPGTPACWLTVEAGGVQSLSFS